MNAARWLVELALLAYPADFRAEYREQILADLDDERAAVWRTAVDITIAGLQMRVDDVARDASFGVRRLRRAPLLVAVVVATFALGIGANVAVFSVLDAVLLKPLPYPNAARLVVVGISDRRGGVGSALSIPDVGDLRENTTQFAAIAAESQDFATLTGSGKPHAIDGMNVTWNYFDVLGLRPELGRFFVEADGRPGVAHAVISDRLWRTRLNADPNIVGKSIKFDGVPIRIVGVAPGVRVPAPDSGSLDRDDFWTPLPNIVAPNQRGARYLGALGLLRPGAALASAQADLALASKRLTARYPRNDSGLTFVASSTQTAFFGNVAPALWTVFAAVIAILLITCANVASLLVTNASTRDREFALRASVGASARRLGRQLFVETAILAVAGGAIGTVLAYVSLHFVTGNLLKTLPRGDAVHVDGLALLYAVGVVLAVTMLAGMWPVAMLRRVRLAETLNAAGRSGDRSAGSSLRASLVAFEIAMALALVVLSGLMLRSFYAFTHVDLGIRTRGVLVSDVIALPGSRYAKQPTRAAFAAALLARLQTVPGVRNAALSMSYPLSNVAITFTVGIVGKTYPTGSEPDAHLNAVTPKYFTILGVPLRRGRNVSIGDTAGSQPVAIVNDAFVQRYLSDRNPIGVRLRTPGWNGAPESTRTIVGVVGNERQRLGRPAPPMYYLPMTQLAPNVLNAVVASDRLTPAALHDALDDAVASIDPLIEAPQVFSIDDLIAIAAANVRSSATLLGTLAFVALLLALSGVFGVVSFGVTQRYREFGVRLALGASTRDVLTDVLRRAILVAGFGILAGAAIAVAGAHAIASQLNGVSPLDPLTFAAVIALLLACASLAALIPAIRATRIDPATALRYE